MEILKLQTELLYNKTQHDQSLKFYYLSFDVPLNFKSLIIDLNIYSKEEAQIPIAVFDSENQIKLMLASEGSKGNSRFTYKIGVDDFTAGAIQGIVKKGKWLLMLYKRRFSEDLKINLEIKAENPVEDVVFEEKEYSFASKTIKNKKAWYSGELHVHSNHSTGRSTIKEILTEAKKQNLDFISVTDHFTASHWQELDKNQNNEIAFLQSMEVSGDKGHANLHGINKWINPLVDDNQSMAKMLNLDECPSMSQIADAVHKDGGLFSLNHVLSGGVSWSYHDFPIQKADILEIWCVSDKETTFLYPTLWDGYLKQGYRLIGVGSSDSHKANDHPTWQLGQIRTWVYCDSLSQKDIIAGLKKGHAYVSYGTSKMDFTAYNNKKYNMGSIIPYENKIEFTVTLENHPSGNLFIYIDGQIHEVKYFDANLDSFDKYSFIVNKKDLSLAKDIDSYVRVEFHEDLEKALFFGMAYRDSKSMRLLSNPIWIRK